MKYLAEAAALGLFCTSALPVRAADLASFAIAGDAIPAPLAGLAGDAKRGQAIVTNRQKGLCLLCHSGPFPSEHFQGDLAPDLTGVGSRLDAGQIRLRIVDMHRLDPDTIMPAYYKIDGHVRIAAAFRDKPILDAQEIEDVVAFLGTLKGAEK